MGPRLIFIWSSPVPTIPNILAESSYLVASQTAKHSFDKYLYDTVDCYIQSADSRTFAQPSVASDESRVRQEKGVNTPFAILWKKLNCKGMLARSLVVESDTTVTLTAGLQNHHWRTRTVWRPGKT